MNRTLTDVEFEVFRKAFDRTERELGREAAIENLIYAARRTEVQRVKNPSPILRAGLGRIVEEVAKAYGVDARAVRGPSRLRHITTARYEAMWRLRNCNLSFQTVGQLLGGRDHATILCGVRVFEERLRTEPALRARLGVDAASPIARAA
jgi:chromosomal replication initiator protein